MNLLEATFSLGTKVYSKKYQASATERYHLIGHASDSRLTWGPPYASQLSQLELSFAPCAPLDPLNNKFQTHPEVLMAAKDSPHGCLHVRHRIGGGANFLQ